MKKILKQASTALIIASFIGVTGSAADAIYGNGTTSFRSYASGSVIYADTHTESTDDAVASVFAPSGDGGSYILRETGGKIGVFAYGSDTPEMVLNVFVFTLPEETAELLCQGIECDAGYLSELIDALTS